MKPKDQTEEETIQRFIDHLSVKEGIAFGITGRDVLVSSGKNFDYEITSIEGKKYAVELFRMVESEQDIANSRGWNEVIGELRKETDKRDLKGYMIYTPSFLYKRSQLSTYVIKQADAIETALKNNNGKEKFEQDGYKFHKLDSLDKLFFSFSNGVRTIDSQGTALASFSGLLPKKNEQLDTTTQHKRIILVQNWAMFVEPETAIKALTKIDFMSLSNIDQIYYEARQNEFVLIFDRNLLTALSERKEVEDSDLHSLLDENLGHLLNEKDPRAFSYIKEISDTKKSIDWLTEKGTRQDLVLFAEAQLREYKDLDTALWVVRMLCNDSDPNPAGISSEGVENDAHADILENKEVRYITSVRGHLCHLISGVISQNKPELYREMLDIIKKFSKEDNLYIRLQVTYPLTEFVTRRRATKNQDETPFIWEQEQKKEVRELAFEMLRQNASHPKVLTGLLTVFQFLRDVSTNEAKEIIETFLNTKDKDVLHELAPLVLYFALLRKSEWKDEPFFNSTEMVKILKDQINNGDDSIRSSMVWHLWKVIQDKVLPYDDVREYVHLYFESSYSHNVVSMLAFIIEELTKNNPKEAIFLYKRMLEQIRDHIEKYPEDTGHWINSTEEVIVLLYDQPDTLLEIVTLLKDFWIKRMYIGDPKLIFESYRNVPTERKEEVKVKLKEMYENMQSINPHLPDIDWTQE